MSFQRMEMGRSYVAHTENNLFDLLGITSQQETMISDAEILK